MEKVWNEVLGMGTLDMGKSTSDASGRHMPMTFTAEDGRKTEFKVIALAVGPPKFLTISAKRMPKLTPEDKAWRSYMLTSGATMAFRFDGPPTTEPR